MGQLFAATLVSTATSAIAHELPLALEPQSSPPKITGQADDHEEIATVTADLDQEEENHGDEADAWRARADALADWAWLNLVNRRDVYGGQRLDPSGEFKRTVWKDGLTRYHLYQHFAAEGTLDVIGLPCTAPDETCRWLGVDIDAHDGQGASPVANLRFALHVLFLALEAGLDVRLVDSSGGRGGYHLWIVFDRSIPMAVARRLAQWLIRDWAAFGLPRRPDLFPGNDRLTGKRCGTWLRLPGRHHKRRSWARVWQPPAGDWLAGDAAIDALLSLEGRPVDPATIVPPSFDSAGPKSPAKPRRVKDPVSSIVRPRPLRVAEPGSRRHGGAARPDRDLRLALAALEAYPNRDLGYDDWLAVGMALRSLGDEEAAFGLWEEWSAASGKHDPEATAAKWRSLRPAGESGGIGLGTLFRRAIDAGWSGPSFFEEVDRRGLRRRTRRSGRSGSIFVPVRVAKDGAEVPDEGDDTRDPRGMPGRVD
jgi:hypothetical protein